MKLFYRLIFFSGVVILSIICFLNGPKKALAVSLSANNTTIIGGVDSLTLTVSGAPVGSTAELWFNTNGGDFYDSGMGCAATYGGCSITNNNTGNSIGYTFTFYVVAGGQTSNAVQVSVIAKPISISGLSGNYSCVDSYSINVIGPPNSAVYLHYWGTTYKNKFIDNSSSLSSFGIGLDSSGTGVFNGNFICNNDSIGTFYMQFQSLDGNNVSNALPFNVGWFTFNLDISPTSQDVTKGNTSATTFSTRADGPNFNHTISYFCSVSPSIVGGGCSVTPSTTNGPGGSGVVSLSTSANTVAQVYTITVSASMSGPGGTYSQILTQPININVIDKRIIVAQAMGISTTDCTADPANCANILLKLQKSRNGSVIATYDTSKCATLQACSFSDVPSNGDSYTAICPSSGTSYTINGTKYIMASQDGGITISNTTPSIKYISCSYVTELGRRNYTSNLNAYAQTILEDRIDINSWNMPTVSWTSTTGASGSLKGGGYLGASIMSPGNWNFNFGDPSGPYYLSSLVHQNFKVEVVQTTQGQIDLCNIDSCTHGSGNVSAGFTTYIITFNNGDQIKVYYVDAGSAKGWSSDNAILIQGYYKPLGGIGVQIIPTLGSSNSEYSASVAGDGHSYSLNYNGSSINFSNLTLSQVPGWTQYNVTCNRSGGWPTTGDTVYLRDVGDDGVTSAKYATVVCDFSGQVSPSVNLQGRSPAGSGVFSRGPLTIPSGNSVELTWTSQNTTACAASGDWSGQKNISGTQTISNVTKASTFTITCTNSYGSDSESFSVMIQSKPSISLNPTSFSFSGISGGSTPSGQTLAISNTGNATLNWSGSTNQSWCHISPSSGNIAAGSNSNITVSVDAPSNVGSFNCTVTITDPNASNSSQTVSVTYTVSPANCPSGQVNLSQTSINVGGTSTASAPSGFSGGLFSSNNTSIATVSGSTVSGVFSGSANISGAGWNNSNGATNCSLSARALTVSNAPKPSISLNPTSFSFSGISGGSTPSGQTLAISNTGNATLNWSGSTNQSWCHISPSSGNIAAGSNSNITVSVDAPSNVGSFNCTVTITDPNASNSSQTVSVTYTVSPANCPSGQVNLSQTSINVGGTSTASAPSGFSGGLFSSNNTSIATVSGSTVSGVFSGSANISGAGWNNSNGATNCSLSARALTVSNAPKPSISLNPTSFSFSGISGGSTPSGQTLAISNTGNATLNWSGSTNQSWCHISPSSGNIAAGSNSNITVSVDAPSNVGSFNCTVTITDPNASNSPQTVSVTYTVSGVLSHTLVLTKSIAEGGSITSSSGKITCDTSCNTQSASYAIGSSEILTASHPGYTLSFNGCTSTSGDVCNVTMDSDKTVTANFTVIPTASCPSTDDYVVLTPNPIKVDGTSIASAPLGWSGGSFQSSDSAIAAASGASGSTITGVSEGLATISGTDWTALNGATNCALVGVAITIKPKDKANLDSSTKELIMVNNTTYNPSTSSLKLGDILTFEITLINTGSAPASDIIVEDTFTNLKIPASGLKAVYSSIPVKNISEGSGQGTYAVSGSDPNKKIIFNLKDSKFNVPVNVSGGRRTLTFQAEIAVPAGFKGLNSRLQNTAVITYDSGLATVTIQKTVTTPIYIFQTGTNAPVIREQAP